MNRQTSKPSPVFAAVSRRTVLQHGLLGAMSWLLAGRPKAGVANEPTPRPPRANAVIQVWLWGGASHLDTFDPKPQAGEAFTGPLNRPIATTDRSVFIGELLPQLAGQFDKYSIIRSMTHGNNSHETASYLVQTGRNPSERVVYPTAGAVVSLFRSRGASHLGLLPPYIVLTQPQGRFDEAGFLGNRYRPFATGGDPNAPRFVVEGLVGQRTEGQLRQRRELLRQLGTLTQAAPGDATLQALARSEEEAYELLLGDASRLFDLDREPRELRDRYGRNTFGQSCLMARRLVQRGVPYVTINFGGWDTHRDHFPAMRTKLPQLDRGLATLFADLADKGLLATTIVWCCGEFGRTPRVATEPPWNGGRHHHGQVFSAIVGGGGFRGGCVVGASDARGETVRDRPVYPHDLIGSMYELLGIDPNGRLPHPQGLHVRVIPDADEEAASGGRLREIM
ncbi:MAG: DUF1501 domain-containing protein [Gemmataceae bacterium]|nr:DUF1501 domain-containing protein [Gemmataceae bacterium]